MWQTIIWKREFNVLVEKEFRLMICVVLLVVLIIMIFKYFVNIYLHPKGCYNVLFTQYVCVWIVWFSTITLVILQPQIPFFCGLVSVYTSLSSFWMFLNCFASNLYIFLVSTWNVVYKAGCVLCCYQAHCWGLSFGLSSFLCW